jgi:hypothetical protein
VQAERSIVVPSLSKVLQQEDMARGGHVTRMDLSPYLEIIASIRSEGGVGGEVQLQEAERKRVEKRRLSIAAKQLGTKVTWRKGQDSVLRFVLSEPGQPVPGGRARRERSAEAETQNGRKRKSSRA